MVCVVAALILTHCQVYNLKPQVTVCVVYSILGTVWTTTSCPFNIQYCNVYMGIK